MKYLLSILCENIGKMLKEDQISSVTATVNLFYIYKKMLH